MQRRRQILTLAGLGGSAAAVAVARDAHLRRRARMALQHGVRTAHHLRGTLRGVAYRARGDEPDPMALDAVLADRVRSELGRLERRLDVPHVHVGVRRHVATLHGEVGTAADVAEIERRVLRVSGIWGVRSFLHVGLAPGDTPPSHGRMVERPSPMLAEMLELAEEWGLHGHRAGDAVRAVLATFAERIPEGERRHLAAHLPADVRAQLVPPRALGHARHRVRHVDEFLSSVAETAGVDAFTVGPVAEAVLGTLRDAVPEEAGDVAAVLPAELRRWWEVAIPA
ncbi:MAG TPA: DUF2267 domain-containing protein [Candidatus Dormibacteraeota bacterium]|nr:DUF2267 domain-containing protein [Candidatus Dormibacteraeota bacterium]